MLLTPNCQGSANGAGLYDNASPLPFGERSGVVPISQAPACMSEYEYYEFLAIDKSLDDGALLALRALSSRAALYRAAIGIRLINFPIRGRSRPDSGECVRGAENPSIQRDEKAGAAHYLWNRRHRLSLMGRSAAGREIV